MAARSDMTGALAAVGSLVSVLTLAAAGVVVGRALYRRREHAPLSSVYGTVRYQHVSTGAPAPMAMVEVAINA